MIEPELAAEMAARLPTVKVIEIPDARHDVHLDRPQEWGSALMRFLQSAGRQN